MDKTKITWSQEALRDIDEIVAYISKDSPVYAGIFVTSIFDRIEVLSSFPEAGRIVPEYQKPEIRELIFRNYRIVYKRSPGIVEIATIFQGSRLLE